MLLNKIIRNLWNQSESQEAPLQMIQNHEKTHRNPEKPVLVPNSLIESCGEEN